MSTGRSGCVWLTRPLDPLPREVHDATRYQRDPGTMELQRKHSQQDEGLTSATAAASVSLYAHPWGAYLWSCLLCSALSPIGIWFLTET